MYNEFIGGDLQLPLQGVLFVNALYPGCCSGLWKSCPSGRSMRNVECSYNMPG